MDEVIGIQAVRAALRDTPSLARNLYVMKGRRDARFNELIGMARESGVRYRVMDGAWFERRDILRELTKVCCWNATRASWPMKRPCSSAGQS